MSTPCCQISTPYRLVVSDYEVPKVFVCKSDTFFLGPPCISSATSPDILCYPSLLMPLNNKPPLPSLTF